MKKPVRQKFAIIIPVYNHEETVREVARASAALGMPVFVVNDGSTDSTPEKIKNIDGVVVLKHQRNLGKGAAILTGFSEAAKMADWAITIDADGQHDPSDALALVNRIPTGTRPLIVGKRADMSGSDVPWTSRFGREFSNFWVRASGGPRIEDTQSGLRIYPLPESMMLNVGARRYQFEVEILVRARWEGIPVLEAPVSVNYSPGSKRISHFHPFYDFLRNTGTFSRLIALRLLKTVGWKFQSEEIS